MLAQKKITWYLGVGATLSAQLTTLEKKETMKLFLALFFIFLFGLSYNVMHETGWGRIDGTNIMRSKWNDWQK